MNDANRDYSYDDEEITLSDTNSSENDAADLGDYPGDVIPQENWPGLSPNPHQQRARPEDMRAVATRVETLADNLRQSDAPSRVADATNMQLGGSSWLTANQLNQANTQVSGFVRTGRRQLIANLDNIAAAIRAAADNYDGAESANTAGANNAGGTGQW